MRTHTHTLPMRSKKCQTFQTSIGKASIPQSSCMLSVTKVFIERLKGVLKQIIGITSGANVQTSINSGSMVSVKIQGSEGEKNKN